MKSLVLLFSVMLIAIGGVALAAHNNSNEIHACYKNVNGQMRYVADPVDCLGSETPITWNVTGAPGTPGPVGPAGGLSNVTYAYADSTTADQMFAAATAQCPTGMFATGGGWTMIGTIGVGSNLDSFLVIANAPTDGTGWQVSIRRSGATGNNRAWGVRTFAICAN